MKSYKNDILMKNPKPSFYINNIKKDIMNVRSSYLYSYRIGL